MIKKLIGIGLLFFAVGFLSAQTTTVSATVIDSDGTSWFKGSWKVEFVPNSQHPNPDIYNINGVPLVKSVMYQDGTMDSLGALSFNVYQNTVVSPAGSSWKITVCPYASGSCGVYGFSTSTTTLDIGSALTGVIPPPRFNAVAGSYGYIDAEAVLTIPVGGTYYNVTSSCPRYYDGTSWACVSGGGGGGTPCVTTNLTLQFNNFGNFGCTVPTYDPSINAFNNLHQFQKPPTSSGFTPSLPGAGFFAANGLANNYYSNIYTQQFPTNQAFGSTGNYSLVLQGSQNQNQNGYAFKPGIMQYSSIIEARAPSSAINFGSQVYQYSLGDTLNYYNIQRCWGGTTAGGDEGCENGDNWLFQQGNEYQGPITAGGTTGSTSITVNPSMVGSWFNNAAGRWMLDATEATTAGIITAITGGGTTYTTATGSGTSWPVSTVNTTLGTAVNPPGVVTVTPGSMTGITTSTVLCISDAGNFEKVKPSATTGTTFTATFRKAYSSAAVVSSGGLCGWYVSFDVDTITDRSIVETDTHYVFPVMRSTSSTSLDFWTAYGGHWSQYFGAAPTGGNTYHLYPGAEVTDVSNGTQNRTDTATMEPNTTAWATSDNVFEAVYPYVSLQGGNEIVFKTIPGPPSFWKGITIGGHFTGGMAYINNGTPVSWYNGAIGRNPPYGWWFASGMWDSYIHVNQTPTSAFNFVGGCSALGTCGTFNWLETNTPGLGADWLQYDQSIGTSTSGEWDLTTGGNHQHVVKFLSDSSVVTQSQVIGKYGALGNAQNLALYSQFPSSSIGTTWVHAGTTTLASQTSNAATDPNGFTTAETVVAPTLTSGQSSGQKQTLTVTSGSFYTFTICIKGHAGGEVIEFGVEGDTNNVSVATATTGWQCFNTVPLAGVASSTINFEWVFIGPFSSGSTVDLAFAQVEESNFHGQYISTTNAAASVTGIVGTQAYIAAVSNATCIGADAQGHLFDNTPACSGGGGSMVWPGGGAGIANYNGALGWGTSYNAGNQIPAAFIPTLNQNTTGTAGNLSGTPTLPNGTSGATQSTSDNTIKLATDAFVHSVVNAGITGGTLTITGGTLTANTCTSNATVTDTGLTTSGAFSRVVASYSGDPTGLTGWDAQGGISLKIWPTSANTATWHICNVTSGSITYSGITVSLGAN